MLEGVLAAVALRPVAGMDQVEAIKYHQTLIRILVIFILGGFFVIYKNKNRYGKPYFVIWHALGGLGTVMLTIGSHMGGFFSFRALGFMPLLPPFFQTRIKTILRFFGSVAFLCGSASLIFGIFTPRMAWGATTWLGGVLTVENASFSALALLAKNPTVGKY